MLKVSGDILIHTKPTAKSPLIFITLGVSYLKKNHNTLSQFPETFQLSLLRSISSFEPYYNIQREDSEALVFRYISSKEFHVFILSSGQRGNDSLLKNFSLGFIGFPVVLEKQKGENVPFLFSVSSPLSWRAYVFLVHSIQLVTSVSSFYVGVVPFFLLLSEYLLFPLS